MRKITDQAIKAFNNGVKFSSGNTTVELSPLESCVVLKLHGNAIARRDLETNKIEVTNAGWYTNTTKERLNGIPGCSVHQKKGEWFLNGAVWSNPEIFTEI